MCLLVSLFACACRGCVCASLCFLCFFPLECAQANFLSNNIGLDATKKKKHPRPLSMTSQLDQWVEITRYGQTGVQLRRRANRFPPKKNLFAVNARYPFSSQRS